MFLDVRRILHIKILREIMNVNPKSGILSSKLFLWAVLSQLVTQIQYYFHNHMQNIFKINVSQYIWVLNNKFTKLHNKMGYALLLALPATYWKLKPFYYSLWNPAFIDFAALQCFNKYAYISQVTLCTLENSWHNLLNRLNKWFIFHKQEQFCINKLQWIKQYKILYIS